MIYSEFTIEIVDIADKDIGTMYTAILTKNNTTNAYIRFAYNDRTFDIYHKYTVILTSCDAKTDSNCLSCIQLGQNNVFVSLDIQLNLVNFPKDIIKSFKIGSNYEIQFVDSIVDDKELMLCTLDTEGLLNE